MGAGQGLRSPYNILTRYNPNVETYERKIMTKKKTEPLKYEAEMSEFLSIMEWSDVKLDVNVQNQQVVIHSGVNIDGQNGQAIIEANSDNDLFDFYIYYTGIECKFHKWEQMQLLMNEINIRFPLGRFECFDVGGDRRIRWRHRIDFEGSNISGVSIRNNFGPGWDATVAFASVIAAVALTKQSAKEAISDYDREREETE